MIDCTCGFGKDIPEDKTTCSVCGADVTPLHRIRNLPRLYYAEGVKAANDGQLDLAIERISTSVSLDESCGPAYKALGDIYFKKNMYEEALRQYGRALQLMPDDHPLVKSKRDAETEIGRRAAPQSIETSGKTRWLSKSLILFSVLSFLLGLTVLPSVNLFVREKRSVPRDSAQLTAEIKKDLTEESVLKGLSMDVAQMSDGLRISGEVPTEIHKKLVTEIVRRVVGDQVPVVVEIRVAATQAVQPALYTVRSGDSLSSLAATLYGDVQLWTKIYAANRDKLSNANSLMVGQVLVIPK
jgi:tetratricopeptide (TPR) repeat protein